MSERAPTKLASSKILSLVSAAAPSGGPRGLARPETPHLLVLVSIFRGLHILSLARLTSQGALA